MSDQKSPSKPVAASEFARNFGAYKLKAQKAAVPVSSHGKIAGYFIAVDEYEDFVRYKSQRRSFATAELPPATMERVAKSRMHARHKPLNKLLEPK